MSLLLPMAALASGPGFDCNKANSQIEKSICAWDTVGSLDGNMATAYKTALAAQKTLSDQASLKSAQLAWLQKRNRQCALNAVEPDPTSEEGLSPKEMGQLMCLQAIYPPRIAQLTELSSASSDSMAQAEPEAKGTTDTGTIAATDPWAGSWSGSGAGTLSATIRRGTAKPEYLAVELITGLPGCSGAVIVYGKPSSKTLSAESYDINNPHAPICKIDFELNAGGTLRTEAYGDCSYYHGGACDFAGTLTRE